eukprot:jgi/Mesen1/5461/ME000273S04694
METLSLQLPPTLRSKLLSAGFKTVQDLQGVGPIELARDASISHEDALHVLKLVPTNNDGEAVAGAKSAWELLHSEKSRRKVTTFCPAVDKILGGGISYGEITEICGVPGVGKTQFGIQLAINVQTPAAFGGLEGQAVYIDTEGSFMVERALELAHAWLVSLRSSSAAGGLRDLEARMHATSPDDVLGNIFYFRVRMIIMDSVTFHFRQDFADMALRTRLLQGMSQKLMSLADRRDVAVVLVNQVTTKVVANNSKLVPALGESWSHACTNRVILYWMDGQRYCHIYKSPHLKAATAPFFITSEGVRGNSESFKRQRTDGDEEASR